MRKRSIILIFVSVLMAFPIQAQEKTTLAILDLHAGGVSETEADAISNRIRNELFLTGKYTVLEREAMEEVLSEQGLEPSIYILSLNNFQFRSRILFYDKMMG